MTAWHLASAWCNLLAVARRSRRRTYVTSSPVRWGEVRQFAIIQKKGRLDMAKAKNLRHLLLIREQNRTYIDGIQGNLGSALGLKNGHGDPAIIIFVPRKINKRWLPNARVIKKTLTGPRNLKCPVDVVEGSAYTEDSDWRLVHIDYNTSTPSVVTRRELLGLRPLKSDGRRKLLEKLRGWTEKVTPGAQLECSDEEGSWYNGTLACFARDRAGKLGFITNHHVASHIGNMLRFPVGNARTLGTVRHLFEYRYEIFSTKIAFELSRTDKRNIIKIIRERNKSIHISLKNIQKFFFEHLFFFKIYSRFNL